MKKTRHMAKVEDLVSLRDAGLRKIEKQLSDIEDRGIDNDTLDEMWFLSRHNNGVVREHVAEIAKEKIKNSGRRAKPELFHLLLSSLGDKDSRFEAVDGLNLYPDRHLVFLIGGVLFQDRDPIIRAGAADSLLSMEDKDAIPFFEGGLQDSDSGVKAACAHALGWMGSRASAERIAAVEERSRNLNTKVACWYALLQLTQEDKWFQKLASQVCCADKQISLKAIDYIDESLDKDIIEPGDALATMNDDLKSEKRKEVKARAKEFTDKWILY